MTDSSGGLNKPCFFLDRDGVICEKVDFLHNIKDFKILPGVIEAIKRLNDAGHLVIVVTNQPMLAMGLLTEAELAQIHDHFRAELARAKAHVDAIYHCPHSPDKGKIAKLTIGCNCRKPKTGMIEQAQKDFKIDMSKSVMVGDSWRDMLLARACGLRALGITGGEGFISKDGHQRGEPDETFASLSEAVAASLS